MNYLFSAHVFRRMVEREFSPDVIKSVIETGSVIKEYLDDEPYPSRLILGFAGDRPIHVVSAFDADSVTEHVITVYQPDEVLWSADFTQRRTHDEVPNL